MSTDETMLFPHGRIASQETERDVEHRQTIAGYFERSPGTTVDKLRNFTKFVRPTDVGRLLMRHELFQRALQVQGSIIECGVFLGFGLMSWAHLSALFEPLNHNREIVGFDTFSGFTGLHEKDRGVVQDPVTDDPVWGREFAKDGAHGESVLADIQEGVRLYDLVRPIGHIPRVHLVKGDAMVTMPRFLEDRPHSVVALLYLDFDIYEPTKVALETFLPRMPKGAVLAFDELYHRHWPGETLAVLDAVGLRNLRIQRFPWQSTVSFAVLE
ncbi:MAG TPA: class I SAM-dependent methyltransferase [Bryobacteraceae bacterium]|nr:class I SAM-dependent methyltransferase [Bryobacteraceae bacterium]